MNNYGVQYSQPLHRTVSTENEITEKKRKSLVLSYIMSYLMYLRANLPGWFVA